MLACIATLVVAALTRLIGLSNQLFIHRDDSGIALWAMELVQTGRFGWTLARPGYVAFLAVPYRLIGDVASGSYVSLAAAVATIGVVGVWTWRLFSPSVAALAVALLTASQIHNYYSRAQQPASVIVLCLVLAGFWYTRAAGVVTRVDVGRALGSGAVLGVALTCHPSSVLFPPLFLVFELALIAELRPWRVSASRFAVMLLGAALPVLVIQLATTWLGKIGGAPTDFVSQFQSAYAYQSAGTNHVVGSEDLLYYPLSVLLVEGPAWALPIAAALLWSALRWIRHRGALQLFLLTQSVGVIVIWSAAGAVGAADHLRVILPAFPAAVILTSLSARELIRAVVARYAGPGIVVTLGMAVAAVATLVLGSYRALPLMTSATGYRELARNLSLEPGVPVLVSGANDRNWRVLMEQSSMLRISTPAEALGLVRGVESLDEMVLPRGGGPCYLIVAPEADVLGYPGSLHLPEIVTKRYEEASRLAGSAPTRRALSDWVRLPIFRLEGVDTGVQQVDALARNGVQLPARAQYTELYRLTGGDAPGCRP